MNINNIEHEEVNIEDYILHKNIVLFYNVKTSVNYFFIK